MAHVQDRQGASAAIAELAPWFHNLHLPDGTHTAPEHVLGDFPRNKWERIQEHVPEDLSGWRVLDIGCNAGFYTLELARRGAHVTAIDIDLHYLRQARWAVKEFGVEQQVEFHQMQVYDLARHQQDYDLVWFMGVFYHLRYPLLALDIIARLAKNLMVFQTMTMPGPDDFASPPDLPLDEREVMCDPAWPKMAFIEYRVAEDPTNWWAPSPSCVEAMLRSSGFRVLARPIHEVYLCKREAQDPLGIDSLKRSEYLAAVQQNWRSACNQKEED